VTEQDSPSDSVKHNTFVAQAARAWLMRGQPLQAIRQVYRIKGCRLRRAGDYVAALAHTEPVNWASAARRVRQMLNQGQWRAAVEWVKTEAGLTPREALNYVKASSQPVIIAGQRTRLPSAAIPQVRAMLVQDREQEAVELVQTLSGWTSSQASAYVALLARGMPETTDYGALAPEELLAALECAGCTPDLELVRTCLGRREALTPRLLELLAQGAEPDWDPEDPRAQRDLHAGLLLCAFKEPAALPVFAQVLRDPARDALLVWFVHELPAAYGPAALSTLTDLVQDWDAPLCARVFGMQMLVTLVRKESKLSRHVGPALRALLPPLTAEGEVPADVSDTPLWTWVAGSLADVKDWEALPPVRALYRAGLIDARLVGDKETFLEVLRGEPEEEGAVFFDILKTYEDLHAEAAWRITRGC